MPNKGQNYILMLFRKVRLAARLRKDTTLNLKWIAQHLKMGSWTHVSNLLGAKTKTIENRTETCQIKKPWSRCARQAIKLEWRLFPREYPARCGKK